MPSPVLSITSVDNPRMVRVAGTTTNSPSWSTTSLRDSNITGRRLLGGRNVYQRISPLLNRTPPTPLLPRIEGPHQLKTRQVVEGRGHILNPLAMLPGQRPIAKGADVPEAQGWLSAAVDHRRSWDGSCHNSSMNLQSLTCLRRIEEFLRAVGHQSHPAPETGRCRSHL